MDIGSKYCFYVGTARGALLYTSEKPENFKTVKCDEPSEITALLFGRYPNELIVGYESGKVCTFNADENKYNKILTKLEGEERVVGLGHINKSIIVGKRDGVINIWNGKRNDYFSLNLDEKGSLDNMVCNEHRKNLAGTGGEFNDFKLWNIETKQCIFKAKSLGHDELQLPIPTSIRGITFFPQEIFLSGCATKEGHVLLYDDRAQRRPVVKFLNSKASYTTISTVYRERQCLVGTTRGYMQLLDMRFGKCLKTYTGFTGSVTSLTCDPLEPYIFSVSLDRYLRIHNLETKELLSKCYMKQNLTTVLMKPVVKDEVEDDVKAEENIDNEYEELFNNMEEIQSDEKLHKQKRKMIDQPKNKKRRKEKIKFE